MHGGTASGAPHESSGACGPVVLWEGARAGMPEADFRRAHPSAEAPFDPMVPAGNWLQMKGPTMDGHDAVLTFYFRQGRLDSVRWSPEARLAHGSAQQAARWLVDRLRERLGAEQAGGKTPDLWGSYTRHVWIDRGLKVVLHLHATFAASLPSASLWVTYSPAGAGP